MERGAPLNEPTREAREGWDMEEDKPALARVERFFGAGSESVAAAADLRLGA